METIRTKKLTRGFFLARKCFEKIYETIDLVNLVLPLHIDAEKREIFSCGNQTRQLALVFITARNCFEHTNSPNLAR